MKDKTEICKTLRGWSSYTPKEKKVITTITKAAGDPFTEGLTGSEIARKLRVGKPRNFSSCLNVMLAKRLLLAKKHPHDKRVTIYTINADLCMEKEAIQPERDLPTLAELKFMKALGVSTKTAEELSELTEFSTGHIYKIVSVLKKRGWMSAIKRRPAEYVLEEKGREVLEKSLDYEEQKQLPRKKNFVIKTVKDVKVEEHLFRGGRFYTKVPRKLVQEALAADPSLDYW